MRSLRRYQLKLSMTAQIKAEKADLKRHLQRAAQLNILTQQKILERGWLKNLLLQMKGGSRRYRLNRAIQKIAFKAVTLLSITDVSMRIYARLVGANVLLSEAIVEYENDFSIFRLNPPVSGPEQIKSLLHWRSKGLANGAFGDVRLVDVETNHDQLAIAVAKSSSKRLEVIQHEADMFTFMREQMPQHHPNIIYFLGLFTIDGKSHLFTDAGDMDLYDFLEVLRKDRCFRSQREVPPYMYLQLASAIAALHNIGVVHGDLKENNVVVSLQNPQKPCLQVIDFGLAQRVNRYGFADLKGCTTNYAPPEQIIYVTKTKTNTQYPVLVSKKADIWSLAIVFFCMATLNRYEPYCPGLVGRYLKDKAGVQLDVEKDGLKAPVCIKADNLLIKPNQEVPAILLFLLLTDIPGFVGGALEKIDEKSFIGSPCFFSTLGLMWSQLPSRRPTADQVKRRLEGYISSQSSSFSRQNLR